MLKNLNNYGPFVEYAQNYKMVLDVNSINNDNWSEYFYGLLNILKDGIETDEVQRNFIDISFGPGLDCELSVVDLFYNLIMWQSLIKTNSPILPKHLIFNETETQGSIKSYIDKYFISIARKKLDNRSLNNGIDDIIHAFVNVDDFALFFANTINLEDDLALMNASKEYYDILHANIDGIPLQDVNNHSLKLTKEAVKIITKSKALIGYDHCLTDSFRAQQGVNIKQYKEFNNIIGTKPDGRGGVYPYAINTSFINGGLSTLAAQVIESSTGRTAQILAKNNVGDSGRLARVLGLNNQDTYLNLDPTYCCDSRNFVEIVIKDENEFKMLSVTGRYYRLHPNGMEYKMTTEDTHLIGQKIYLRSPMTCASAAKGNGVCFRCYGDLAYTNWDISIGKYAAENLSEKFTQRMLSAKHLLESKIKKMKWVPEFFNFFEVDANLIVFNSDLDYSGWSIVINPDDIILENEDDFKQGDDESYSGDIYNEYVTSFVMLHKNGDYVVIKTENNDNLYISKDLNDLIRSKAKKFDDKLSITIDESMMESALFVVAIHNNELSQTMNKVIDTIDKNEVTTVMDKNQLLQTFIDTICEGGLDIDSVHCEVILSNQLRCPEDKNDITAILKKPDWSVPNIPYKVMTLNQALNANPSITIRLNYENIPRALYNPLTFRMHAPSFMDLFFMEKPQEFLNAKDEIVPAKKEYREQNYEIPITVIEDDDIQD